MASVQKLVPCLWFDNQAEDAAKYYVSIFKNSKLGKISYYGKDQGAKDGAVLVAEFEIEGQKFIGLNGGPQFKFTEAVSFYVNCDTQAEIDYFWEKLTADGGQEGPCGWVKDKFGLSWQIVPAMVIEMISGPDRDKADRVLAAVMKMGKLDIAELQRAYAG